MCHDFDRNFSRKEVLKTRDKDIFLSRFERDDVAVDKVSSLNFVCLS